MSLKKRIIFIVNPISGTHSKETIPQLIEEKIDHSKYDYSIQRTQYAGNASQIAAEAARDGVDIVVAVGGDGTINEIGRALIHTRTAMGIIPCGSGNGLARHLNIPMIARKALDVINAGTVRTIDYGIIDGHPFFCTCGVGFDAFVSLKFSDSGKRGLLTYLENTLHESLTYQPEIYEIENASGTARYKAFLIACANASQYGNNAYIAPQASLTAGMMDITVLEPQNKKQTQNKKTRHSLSSSSSGHWIKTAGSRPCVRKKSRFTVRRKGFSILTAIRHREEKPLKWKSFIRACMS